MYIYMCTIETDWIEFIIIIFSLSNLHNFSYLIFPICGCRDAHCFPLCSILFSVLIISNCIIRVNIFAIWISFLNSFRLDKPECKRCTKALQELENIDDEADQLEIGFVKIHDESLADEYNLGTLPALVYYRHQIPILYEGLYKCHL